MDFKEVKILVDKIDEAKDLLEVLEGSEFFLSTLKVRKTNVQTPIFINIDRILGGTDDSLRRHWTVELQTYIANSEKDLKAMIENEDT